MHCIGEVEEYCIVVLLRCIVLYFMFSCLVLKCFVLHWKNIQGYCMLYVTVKCTACCIPGFHVQFWSMLYYCWSVLYCIIADVCCIALHWRDWSVLYVVCHVEVYRNLYFMFSCPVSKYIVLSLKRTVLHWRDWGVLYVACHVKVYCMLCFMFSCPVLKYVALLLKRTVFFIAEVYCIVLHCIMYCFEVICTILCMYHIMYVPYFVLYRVAKTHRMP